VSNIVTDPNHLREVLAYFERQDAFAFDVESFGENRGEPTQNTLNWLSMATKGMAVAIPFGHPNGDRLISKATRRMDKATRKFTQIPARYEDPPAQMRPSEVFGTLRPLFFGDQIKIAHNATFDLVSVAKYFGGECPTGPYEDTIVMQWLLDENLKTKGLKDMTIKRYGVSYDDEHVGRMVEAHPFSKVGRYAYLDAKYTWLHRQRMRPLLEEQGLWPVFDLEMDVLKVLLGMKMHGAVVDEEAIRNLEVDLSERLVDIEATIYQRAGRRFNINSTADKVKVLYDPKDEGGQGLRPLKETPGGQPSTDRESLEAHESNPLVQALLEYAEINKLLGTYVRGYLGDPEDPKKPSIIYDGRIHADLVQYGTVTGRFSCREPNLQNIPRPDSDLGKKIRGLFVAPPGYKMIVADYGQIEMVLLAHYIGKGRLFNDLLDGGDPHSATAAALMGLDYAEFIERMDGGDAECKQMRQVAKGLNFAIVYGAGPDKVAAMAGISVKEAKRFLKMHAETFPEIHKFKDRVIETCKARRPAHIVTLLGRKRRLPTIFSKDWSVAGYAERQAVNSLVQGSAADIIKLAMVRLDAALPEDMHLILSVHDELVTLAPEHRVEEAVELVREAMLGTGIKELIHVPLKSDIKVVDRWAEAK
jgi:DNA polymerase-1